MIAVLISAAVGSCAVPQVVTPEIAQRGYAEMKAGQPDCTPELDALEAAEFPTHELALDALHCYRRVWKYWEGGYRVLDAQVEAVGEGK